MEVESLRPYQTFEEWSVKIHHEYEGQEVGERAWISVGDWLLNAKENNAYTNERVAYHVCRGNYQRIYATELGIKTARITASSVSDIEEGCKMCYEPMPDGIKMIALLEKL